jgi:hypothetical protein
VQLEQASPSSNTTSNITSSTKVSPIIAYDHNTVDTMQSPLDSNANSAHFFPEESAIPKISSEVTEEEKLPSASEESNSRVQMNVSIEAMQVILPASMYIYIYITSFSIILIVAPPTYLPP